MKMGGSPSDTILQGRVACASGLRCFEGGDGLRFDAVPRSSGGESWMLKANFAFFNYPRCN